MLGYWLGLISGLLAVVTALAIITGVGFAAVPALLIFLLFLAGLDLPLLAAGGVVEWRAEIAKASLPFSQTYIAGWSVFVLPFFIAWPVSSLWSTFWGLLAAWLVFILGAVFCSFFVVGWLVAVAKQKNSRVEARDS
ncbi:MAG: hypothetical protein AAGI68_13760 [Planctomycetota bacterium]